MYGFIWFKKGMICWDNTGILMDISSDNLTNIAIEHGPVEIVDLPINSMVIFQFAMLVYQRVLSILLLKHLSTGFLMILVYFIQLQMTGIQSDWSLRNTPQ